MLTERLVAGGDANVNLASGPAAGPALLFLHGVGRAWQDYLSLVPALAWRWQVHALDFRGHGRSQRTPGKYLVVDYVRDAVATIGRHISGPTVVYGHSLGALVAAAAAAELPELVRGAVLEDPPFEIVGPDIVDSPFYSLFRVMQSVSGSQKDVSALCRELADKRIGPADSEGVRLGDIRDASALRFGAACLAKVDRRVWDPLLEGRWLEGYDTPAVLGKIACPVLLLQGDTAGGGMLCDADAGKVAAAIRDCYHVRVAGGGHLVHGLRTETTLRLVGGFLESIAISTAR